MRVALSSLYLEDDLQLLKLAALYADRIVVPDVGGAVADPANPDEPVVEGKELVAIVRFVARTCPDVVRHELAPLLTSGIAVLDSADHAPQIDQTPFYEIFEELQKRYFRREGEMMVTLLDEIGLVGSGLSACARRDTPVEDLFSLGYFYVLQAHAVIGSALRDGASPLTDSDIVRDMLAAYGRRSKPVLRVSGSSVSALSQRVLTETLPRIVDAPIADILEVRYLMRDELEAFRDAMAKLANSLNSHPFDSALSHELDRIVTTSVAPSVNDLKRRLVMERRRAISRIFDNLRNPATYVPLVGSFVMGISPTVALAASAGIATFKAIYDTWLENSALRQENGLVFLCKPRGPAKNWAA